MDIHPSGISFPSADILPSDRNPLLTDTCLPTVRGGYRSEGRVSAEGKDISEGWVSIRRKVSVKGEQYGLREGIC